MSHILFQILPVASLSLGWSAATPFSSLLEGAQIYLALGREKLGERRCIFGLSPTRNSAPLTHDWFRPKSDRSSDQWGVRKPVERQAPWPGQTGQAKEAEGQTLPGSPSCWKAQPRFKFTRQCMVVHVGHVPLLCPAAPGWSSAVPLGLFLNAVCTVFQPVIIP